MKKKVIHVLACDAFLYELEKVKENFACELKVKYLSQKLHVDFDKLKQKVSIELEKDKYDILLYGSKCHPDFPSFLPYNIQRIEEVNCIHALTGWNTENHSRTFFLNPLQVKNWQTFFAYDQKRHEEKIAFKENFCKYCDNAIFMDTGTHKINKEQLTFFSQATGLPVQVEIIELEYFRQTLNKTIKKALAAKA